jgi:hypothetical protein
MCISTSRGKHHATSYVECKKDQATRTYPKPPPSLTLFPHFLLACSQLPCYDCLLVRCSAWCSLCHSRVGVVPLVSPESGSRTTTEHIIKIQWAFSETFGPLVQRARQSALLVQESRGTERHKQFICTPFRRNIWNKSIKVEDITREMVKVAIHCTQRSVDLTNPLPPLGPKT